MTESLSTSHTFELGPAVLAEIRALLDDAFERDFTDEDFDHGLGGVHALVRDGAGSLVAHGSVIQRRVLHEGMSHRIGYVEAVAVRADRRRHGLGNRVMAALEQVIDGAYEAGALSASDEGALLYRARGWQVWRGPIETLGPGGVMGLPDEEGAAYLRPVTWRPVPGRSALVFDWRAGDVL